MSEPEYESEREMMTTPSAIMPTNSRPMAVSSLRCVCRWITSTAPTITAAATAAPRIEDHGGRDTRQHPVDEGVTEEAHATEHEPDADGGAHHRGDEPTDEGPLLEAQQEGVEKPISHETTLVNPAPRR